MASCPQCGERFDDAKYCPLDGAELKAASGPSRIGQVVGERYRIVGKLGEGGVGEIFEAEHLYVRKRVALKLLRPAFAADPETVGRLEHEARSASAIGHPNIVRVEDFGRSDEQAYLAMELVEGESLDQYIARGDTDLSAGFELMAQVCDGLAAAHAAGVIHRDLKPANIVVTRDGDGRLTAKVLDFGIAKLVTADANLTRTGSLVGTPYYMAPEQAHGAAVDRRADVYAVGVMLYELVTGAPPFTADSFISILHKHTSEDPEPASARAPERAIPAAVDRLILRCLAKDPDARHPDMETLGVELRRLAAGDFEVDEELGRAPEPTVPRAGQQPEAPGRLGKRRAVLAIAAAGAGIAGAVAIAAAMSGNGGAPAIDAGVSASAIDAAAADAEPSERDESEAEGWRFRGETGDATFVTEVIPAAPQPRRRVDVELEIEPIDPELQRAIASEKVEARFLFEYYGDHRIVAEVAREVDAEGYARAILSLPDPGKYHVSVALRRGERELSRIPFDLCVGADPRDPEAREAACPGMRVLEPAPQ